MVIAHAALRGPMSYCTPQSLTKMSYQLVRCFRQRLSPSEYQNKSCLVIITIAIFQSFSIFACALNRFNACHLLAYNTLDIVFKDELVFVITLN